MIDWYLPGTKAGGPVRSVFSLLSAMKKHYDFYVITTNCDLGNQKPYDAIIPDSLIFEENVHYFYFSKEKKQSNEILKLLADIKPDLIYLNSFWSYDLSIKIVRLRSKNAIACPVLLAPRGMLGKGALGIKSAKKKLFLSVAKLLGWYKEICFHATQQQERRDISALFPQNKIWIAPNISAGEEIINSCPKSKDHLKLFYLSRISPVKNLKFALNILKEVDREFTIQYDIYGNLEDLAYWLECQNLIKTMPSNIKVTYKRELQFNEVQSTISNYHALFLPTLNENFGHSIVESLLSGCPVIISDQTPWNDVEKNGAGYAISLDNPEKFLKAISDIADLNQEEFSLMSKNANKYISQKINIIEIVSQYKNMFNDSIKN